MESEIARLELLQQYLEQWGEYMHEVDRDRRARYRTVSSATRTSITTIRRHMRSPISSPGDGGGGSGRRGTRSPASNGGGGGGSTSSPAGNGGGGGGDGGGVGGSVGGTGTSEGGAGGGGGGRGDMGDRERRYGELSSAVRHSLSASMKGSHRMAGSGTGGAHSPAVSPAQPNHRHSSPHSSSVGGSGRGVAGGAGAGAGSMSLTAGGGGPGPGALGGGARQVGVGGALRDGSPLRSGEPLATPTGLSPRAAAVVRRLQQQS